MKPRIVETQVNSKTINNDQNIILGGYLQNDADFDPGPDTFLPIHITHMSIFANMIDRKNLGKKLQAKKQIKNRDIQVKLI